MGRIEWDKSSYGGLLTAAREIKGRLSAPAANQRTKLIPRFVANRGPDGRILPLLNSESGQDRGTGGRNAVLNRLEFGRTLNLIPEINPSPPIRPALHISGRLPIEASVSSGVRLLRRRTLLRAAGAGAVTLVFAPISHWGGTKNDKYDARAREIDTGIEERKRLASRILTQPDTTGIVAKAYNHETKAIESTRYQLYNQNEETNFGNAVKWFTARWVGGAIAVGAGIATLHQLIESRVGPLRIKSGSKTIANSKK